MARGRKPVFTRIEVDMQGNDPNPIWNVPASEVKGTIATLTRLGYNFFVYEKENTTGAFEAVPVNNVIDV